MNFRALYLSIACLPVTEGFGQNLVGNGSFEEFTDCPDYYNQVERCIGWFPSTNNNNAAHHTEFLHACSSSMFSAPSNTWGFQEPLTGDGYMALCTMSPDLSDGYRENIYTELLAPTEIGMEYTVRVSLSHTDNSQFASNNFGVKLSTSSDFPVDNDPQVVLADIVMNKTGWTTFTATFVAEEAFTHLALGNFMSDASTITVDACPSCSFDLFGYYLDDVCLVPSGGDICAACKEEIDPPTATQPARDARLSITPTLLGNGVHELHVSTMTQLERVQVFDADGRLVLTAISRGLNSTKVPTRGLANGSYSVTATAEDGTRLSARFVVAR
ncbi:MAG: hypothetical protein JNM62_05825 [Flavobacteriales bacterium]|nr:hypothetical protein [Flavobacteriales bacterium]